MSETTQTLSSQYVRAQSAIREAEHAKKAVSVWGSAITLVVALIVAFNAHLAWTGQWSSLPLPLYLLCLGLIAVFIYYHRVEEARGSVSAAHRSQSLDLASGSDFDAVECVLGGEVEEVFEGGSQLEVHASSWLLNRAERDSDFAGRLNDAGFAFERVALRVGVLDRLA